MSLGPRRALALLPLLAALSCGGGDSPPSGGPIVLPTSETPAPKGPAKPTPSGKPTAKPPPTPTTPPPPSGAVMSAKGAFLVATEPNQARRVSSDCAATFPEIERPKCFALTLDGGEAVWVTGQMDGGGVVWVLTQADGGFVVRYAGREGGSKWQAVNAFATPLTGRGTDGLVVSVRLRDGALTYDLLTWVKGGPLVLRAHRAPLADGRVVPREGRLDEYQMIGEGRYARREVGWDGRYFRLGAARAVDPANVPPR